MAHSPPSSFQRQTNHHRPMILDGFGFRAWNRGQAAPQCRSNTASCADDSSATAIGCNAVSCASVSTGRTSIEQGVACSDTAEAVNQAQSLEGALWTHPPNKSNKSIPINQASLARNPKLSNPRLPG